MPELGQRAFDLVGRRLGLRDEPAARSRLERCLRTMAADERTSPGDLLTRLAREPALADRLVDLVTVHESWWFREPEQLKAFRDSVLPALPRPLTLWCAGCAEGQEPYSLAMLLDEAGIGDWDIIATDVSEAAVAATAAASYRVSRLRGLSPDRRSRYLELDGDGMARVVPRLRSRVTVVRHNVVTDHPPRPAGSVPVVFCRNLLIYLAPDRVASFGRMLADWLPADGWAFLSVSESLPPVTGMSMVRLAGAFAFRPDAATTSPATRPPAGAARPSSKLPRHDPPAPAHEPPAGRRKPVAPRPGTSPDADALVASGVERLADGDVAAALTAFRAAAYLEPDNAVTHLHLGIALEQAGEPSAADRALRAARAALARQPTEDAAALTALLDTRLAAGEGRIGGGTP